MTHSMGRPEAEVPQAPSNEVRPTGSPLRARIAALLECRRAERAEDPTGRGRGAAAVAQHVYPVCEADLNRIHLTGTLGSEPLLYDVGDHPVAALALASERRCRTAAGAWQLDTSWFNLVAMEEFAEHCGRLLHRGDRVYVEGRLELWSANHGPQTLHGHTVLLDRVVLLQAHTPEPAISKTVGEDRATPAARDAACSSRPLAGHEPRDRRCGSGDHPVNNAKEYVRCDRCNG